MLKALKPRDRGGLVTFSHIVAQPAPLTSDLDPVRNAIDEAYGIDETAVADGVYASPAARSANAPYLGAKVGTPRRGVRRNWWTRRAG